MSVAACPPKLGATRTARWVQSSCRFTAMADALAPAIEPSTECAGPSWARPPDFDALSRYGWLWQAESTVDENYMDLAYLIARNSSCKDGHMGCVVVRGLATGQGGDCTPEAVGTILLCIINTPLFGAHRSDCHAEANAVSECARRGEAFLGLSCFVTRSPCVACYKLLAAAGVRRIVSPQRFDSSDCAASAAALGIEVCCVLDTTARAAFREQLGSANEDMERVRALREERKRLRKEHKFGRKTIQKNGQESATAEEEEAPDPSMVE